MYNTLDLVDLSHQTFLAYHLGCDRLCLFIETNKNEERSIKEAEVTQILFQISNQRRPNKPISVQKHRQARHCNSVQ